MSTLEGIPYKDFGLDEKPIININDSIERAEASDFDKKLLDENIKKFRTINYLK